MHFVCNDSRISLKNYFCSHTAASYRVLQLLVVKLTKVILNAHLCEYIHCKYRTFWDRNRYGFIRFSFCCYCCFLYRRKFFFSFQFLHKSLLKTIFEEWRRKKSHKNVGHKLAKQQNIPRWMVSKIKIWVSHVPRSYVLYIFFFSFSFFCNILLVFTGVHTADSLFCTIEFHYFEVDFNEGSIVFNRLDDGNCYGALRNNELWCCACELVVWLCLCQKMN